MVGTSFGPVNRGHAAATHVLPAEAARVDRRRTSSVAIAPLNRMMSAPSHEVTGNRSPHSKMPNNVVNTTCV